MNFFSSVTQHFIDSYECLQYKPANVPKQKFPHCGNLPYFILEPGFIDLNMKDIGIYVYVIWIHINIYKTQVYSFKQYLYEIIKQK